MSAIERPRPDGDLDRRLVAAPGLDRALEVEDDPRVGGLLELELLDLDVAVARGRLPVDPVEAVARRPRPDGRGERRRLERPLGDGVGCPRGSRPAAATAGSARSAGRRRPRRPARPTPTPRRTRTGRRSGSGAARSGSGRAGRAGPGRATTARPCGPSEIARPGRPPGSVVGLWTSSQGFGMRLVLRSVYVTRIRRRRGRTAG